MATTKYLIVLLAVALPKKFFAAAADSANDECHDLATKLELLTQSIQILTTTLIS